MIDRKQLRELAEKATPGPWRAGCRDVGCPDDNYDWVASEHSGLGWEIEDANGNNLPEPMRGMLDRGSDAVFIAAANPQTILVLLDELDAQDARIAKLRTDVRKVIGDSDEEWAMELPTRSRPRRRPRRGEP